MAEENKLLLGVADCFLEPKEDVDASWSINKFGGVPNWMPNCSPSSHPKCGSCCNFLYLVAQIYCPLKDDEHHRTLYIFGCFSKNCGSSQASWVALRCQFIEENTTVEVQKAPESKAEDTWCADSDDWGIEDDGGVNEVDMMFDKMTTEERPAVAELKDDMSKRESESGRKAIYLELCGNRPPCFRPFYVHVIEEPDSSASDSFDYEFRLLREYEAREGVLGEGSTAVNSSEKYEKSPIADGDRTFHKFQKRIRKCKEQCLRYKWNGEPLYLSENVVPITSLEHVPTCLNCGSERVFEIQLMPALVSFLTQTNERNLHQGASSYGEEARIDFGTVFIYTCERSCSRTIDGYNIPIEEFVAMQPSPDSDILTKMQHTEILE